MKLPCEIIEDLLPLYEEGICSEETRKAVEQHLDECEKCKRLYKGIQEIPEVRFESPKPVQDKAMKKGLKKIKKYWWASIIIVIMIVPLSILGWNQFQGVGRSFTNWRELRIADAFMEELKQEDYEGAFGYVDSEHVKKTLRLGPVKGKEFDTRAVEVFVESANKLNEAGGIGGYKFASITKEPDYDYYNVQYYVKVGKVQYKFVIAVADDGVRDIYEYDHSFKTDPLTYFTAWTEWLWEDLNDCYYDFETNEYVYY